MKWSKPRRIVPGHYRPPSVKLPGLSNMPAPGRPSKMIPQLKKLYGKKRG